MEQDYVEQENILVFIRTGKHRGTLKEKLIFVILSEATKFMS